MSSLTAWVIGGRGQRRASVAPKLLAHARRSPSMKGDHAENVDGDHYRQRGGRGHRSSRRGELPQVRQHDVEVDSGSVDRQPPTVRSFVLTHEGQECVPSRGGKLPAELNLKRGFELGQHPVSPSPGC